MSTSDLVSALERLRIHMDGWWEDYSGQSFGDEGELVIKQTVDLVKQCSSEPAADLVQVVTRRLLDSGLMQRTAVCLVTRLRWDPMVRPYRDFASEFPHREPILRAMPAVTGVSKLTRFLNS